MIQANFQPSLDTRNWELLIKFWYKEYAPPRSDTSLTKTMTQDRFLITRLSDTTLFDTCSQQNSDQEIFQPDFLVHVSYFPHVN